MAGNAEGTNEGGVANLETEPSGPKVLMHHARNVGASSAELSASVNPHGSATECYFEYGTTRRSATSHPANIRPAKVKNTSG